VNALAPPLALIAELTHRCPLSCPYCSNPTELTALAGELSTEGWRGVLEQAAALGVLHVHFTGGEPMARRDLDELVRAASGGGLYTNLITSAVALTDARMQALAKAGLDHVQISFQDAEPGSADRIGGYRGGHERKRAAASRVREAGLALTLNFVVHRQNLERLQAMIAMGVELGAGRNEIAHVQYHGWALANRAALLPTAAQVEAATAEVEAARAELKGALVIDYVAPDYHAQRPKACMGGWARQSLLVTPAGKALPCHAAESLPGMDFPSVREHALAEIWANSPAFNRFRGLDWMPEPCRSCELREVDFGGCRCQALALTGDATRTDPVCALAPDHALVLDALEPGSPSPLRYRVPA
jgi:pyrroloquinoline quinone biosynthesis protein E